MKLSQTTQKHLLTTLLNKLNNTNINTKAHYQQKLTQLTKSVSELIRRSFGNVPSTPIHIVMLPTPQEIPQEYTQNTLPWIHRHTTLAVHRNTNLLQICTELEIIEQIASLRIFTTLYHLYTKDDILQKLVPTAILLRIISQTKQIEQITKRINIIQEIHKIHGIIKNKLLEPNLAPVEHFRIIRLKKYLPIIILAMHLRLAGINTSGESLNLTGRTLSILNGDIIHHSPVTPYEHLLTPIHLLPTINETRKMKPIPRNLEYMLTNFPVQVQHSTTISEQRNNHLGLVRTTQYSTILISTVQEIIQTLREIKIRRII